MRSSVTRSLVVLVVAVAIFAAASVSAQAAPEPTPAADQPTPAADEPAPAADEPAPAADEPTPAADQPMPAASSADVSREAAFEAVLSLQLLSRRYTYNDDVYGFLRPYTLPAGPSIGVDVRWYPARHFTHSIASKFGVDVRFDRAFGIESQRSSVLRYDTVNRIFEASALFRYVISHHAIVGSFGYGSHAYQLRNGQGSAPGLNTTPDVPNVAYSYLRYGLEARLAPRERIGILGGFSYLQVLDSGGIQADVWFPRSTAGGIQMNAALVLGLPHHVELRVGLEHRRYFHSMHVRHGDPFIAGGALDRFTVAQLSVAYRY